MDIIYIELVYFNINHLKVCQEIRLKQSSTCSFHLKISQNTELSLTTYLLTSKVKLRLHLFNKSAINN